MVNLENHILKMKCPATGREDCEVCENIKPLVPFWEDQWNSFYDAVRWDELRFAIVLYGSSYLIWHSWGLLIAFVINYIMYEGNVGQGGFADFKEVRKTKKHTFYCNLCKKEETIFVEDK